MPVTFNIPLRLKMEDILRRMGMKGHKHPKAHIKNLIDELLTNTENMHLLEPAIAYKLYAIDAVCHDQLSLGDNRTLHGRLLPSVFLEAQELAAIVCTIGPRLENETAGYFRNKDPLRGILLDSIGSAAVDALVHEIRIFITNKASSYGFQASSPLSPGMPGLPISEQRRVFELVPTRKIGVKLTSTGMMVPLKSTSMVIGIGSQMKTWTQAEVCARCGTKETCPHRVCS